MEILVFNQPVRLARNGYMSLTDMAKVRGGYDHLKNWMRNAETLSFIEAWEEKYNPRFNPVEFDPIRKGIGKNTYTLSADQLAKAGAKSIIVQRGRYGGTYGAIQLALHFANWLDAKFYLEVIDEYLALMKATYGEDAARWRFARELAAENYGLQQAAKRSVLPRHTDKLGVRRAYASEADLINIAVFNITAEEWRQANPKIKGNMRDYATPEELKTIAALEHLNSQYIKHGADIEARLMALSEEADRLLSFYYGCHLKRQLQKKKRR